MIVDLLKNPPPPADPVVGLREGGGSSYDAADRGLNARKRLALLTTVTLEKAIAAPARSGLNKRPKNGYKSPAATGTPRVL